jgi:hypothetical protein
MKKLLFIAVVLPVVVFMLVTVSNAVDKMTKSVTTLSSIK